MELAKYSFGVGDRFGRQGKSQLAAIMKAGGFDLVPVWNKSFREHQIIHSEPSSVRQEADQAVKALGWTKPYYVDADHINLKNVDLFLGASDFFTIDVADYIGKPADKDEVDRFLIWNEKYIPELRIPGIPGSYKTDRDLLSRVAGKYLHAAGMAADIYRHIESRKGKGAFIPEVSMDEVDQPQVPLEMFFILSALAMYQVPLQTIAPKFTGRFNKGVDYEGDVSQFRKEFEEDVLVLDFAVKEFGLPSNLKLSVHSGSDKFSIYPVMSEVIRKHDKGIHVKTAGTTWLEEVIGLSVAGADGLEAAKLIYRKAFGRMDELCGPYATVISIDKKRLPSPEEVDGWSGKKFADSLRHIPDHSDYNPHLRQLLHVGYKVAAEMGEEYLGLLGKYEEVVGQQVTTNIYERHLKRLLPV